MAKIDKPKVIYSTQPRIRLEPYRGGESRVDCPSCGAKKSFARFIDITNGEYVGNNFGRCNRSEKCGYQLSPTGDDFKGKKLEVNSNEVLEQFREKEITNLIPSNYLLKSINERPNNFTQFLYGVFDKEVVDRILKRYKLGSIEMWEKDATIFWQIDREYDVRTGKIMLYDSETGKRVKKRFNHITWAHTPFRDDKFGNNPDFCLTQCFFGEHLLNEDSKEFHIVESEKTAIICSIANPKTYWLSTGGLQNINEQRLLPFKDKKLIFYPDKGKAFEEWTKKLIPFMNDYNIVISKSVEKMENLKMGDDIGDFILKKFGKKKNK